MRFTFWFFGQEILDFHLQAKQPKATPAEKEKLGGGSFGNFEFGYSVAEGEVNAKQHSRMPRL